MSTVRRQLVLGLWAVALLVLGFAAESGRRKYIQSFFRDARPGAPPALTQGQGAGLTRATRVRVVLIDGLDARTAHTLPAWNGLCAHGLDLEVDVGFPTVSLPVQSALWTGLTQNQSGTKYRLSQMAKPPRGSIPARVVGSIAVAESHPEIVGSFGFTAVMPSAANTFPLAAVLAVGGTAPLVFVHELEVDEIGHKRGGGSPEYRAAAHRADALLTWILAADPRPDTRWFLLSDHGHIPAGGHGGEERAIRLVRSCIVGHVPRKSGNLHMVDVSRALADSLGLAPEPASRGRPLDVALAHPDPARTIPRAPFWRRATALALVLAGVIGMGWCARGAAGTLPFWWPVSYAATVALLGAPTLSRKFVYAPLGRDFVEGAAAGLVMLLLAAVAFGGWRRRPFGRLVGALFALPVAACLALLVLSGVPGNAPLLPLVTAHASYMLVVVANGATTLAVAALGCAMWPQKR